MKYNLIGREKDIKKLDFFAELDCVENYVFLGLKGVGKTSLIRNYFTKSKQIELASTFKNIFLRLEIDDKKKGTDLYYYLAQTVKGCVRYIPDEDDVDSLKDEFQYIDETYDNYQNRLEEYLCEINDRGYTIILILDNFHCLERDTDVGSDQYNVLRSLNDLNVFWLVTDTDLTEENATKEYVASLFSQKFTNFYTVNPIEEMSARKDLVRESMRKKRLDLSDDCIDVLADITGGLPELVDMFLNDYKIHSETGNEPSIGQIRNYFISDEHCRSLYKSWLSGLRNEQLKILVDIAKEDANSFLEDVDKNALEKLSNKKGRGILYETYDADELRWDFCVPVFKDFIITEGSNLYENDNKTIVNDILGNNSSVSQNIVINNYYGNVTNNILNIDSAIDGLETLYKLVNKNTVLLDEKRAQDAIGYLPFQDNSWDNLTDDEKEKGLDEYANKIITSDMFANEDITDLQKKQFCLSDDIISCFSDECRKQITCGIQIYSLIQLCIDNFGLNIDSSESARGILFVKAFERHVKDYMGPAFKRISLFKREVVNKNKSNITFEYYDIEKTTLGTYGYILDDNNKKNLLAKVSKISLNKADHDYKWWNSFISDYTSLKDLRNKCCHSENQGFDNNDLKALIDLMFVNDSLSKVMFFKELPDFDNNYSGNSKQNSNNGNRNTTPPLIGSKTSFVMERLEKNGDISGQLIGNYNGVIPAKEAKKINFSKKATINGVISAITNGKYIIKPS